MDVRRLDYDWLTNRRRFGDDLVTRNTPTTAHGISSGARIVAIGHHRLLKVLWIETVTNDVRDCGPPIDRPEPRWSTRRGSSFLAAAAETKPGKTR